MYQGIASPVQIPQTAILTSTSPAPRVGTGDSSIRMSLMS
jgi:hypothetical protein